MKTIPCIIFLIFLSVAFSFAGIINVPGDTVTIQGGIALADSGDTVLVQPGHYIENINFNGKDITVGSLFLVTNNKTYISQTVIDGDSSDSVVSFGSGEDTTSVLVGFTITNGRGGLVEGAIMVCSGGGIDCKRSNPTLKNLFITGNNAYRGGGIMLESSSPKLTDVTITQNFAIYGGSGIHFGLGGQALWHYPSGSSPEFNDIYRCNIYSNYSEDSLGNDLAYWAYDTTKINVLVDTFSVLIPDSLHAYPVSSFILDISHGLVTDVQNVENFLPNNIILKQNYPNPFNPFTNISYKLPKPGDVKLSIYNVLGQKVATLVNKNQPAGVHRVVWDASERL